ncbi:dnaJ-like protein subfamily C member 2 [Senna tora]|uniref:DnaJ-like protein subfamily C member 2 n=1 Tax=Senna tora TaxID=362788 RepID=A0A834XE37_9FABA|nr:dnaJ-like protein subfamily C member 2 [Senna tora]KAF7842750.1 dnaJ-like protein subfamily C member 2 [Senna tora]
MFNCPSCPVFAAACELLVVISMLVFCDYSADIKHEHTSYFLFRGAIMMAVHTNLRLIAYSEEIVDGQPIFVSSNCLPIKAWNYEPAGHSFHSAALKLLGVEEDNSDGDDEKVVDDKEKMYYASSDSYSSKSKKKSGSGDKQQDHYALLGLGHLRYLATEDQIRKSYRETALRYHPDKQAALLLAEETEAAKQAKKDEIESHFKAIQEAYEVLIDPLKRRIYDSTDEFDDEIPTDCAPQDFFKVFGPAFMRNGRWSVNQPIPSLGDDNTPFKEVDKFYDFWYTFKSWREFPHADEFDLEQAESRDHRRWMERQNAKLSEKARKEEYARIRTLVDNAYKRDPRILRRKEEEKAEKQRKKEAKFLAKKLQEEEAARIAEEERRRKEEKRTSCRSCFTTKEESLCMSLDIEQLKSLCQKMESKPMLEQAEILRDTLGRKKDVDDKRDKKTDKQNGSVKANDVPSLSNYVEKKEKPWNKEEIELLRKGMQKYPKGTLRRWEVISEYIGTGRSVEEIMKATKTVLLQKPDSSKSFDAFLEKRKPAPSIASPLSTREELTGESTPGRPENNTTSTMNNSEDSHGKSTSDNLKATGSATAHGASSSSEQDTWSAVQERALVQALKAFPKETNQRWERVAAAVPGKTVNQCKKKFTMLKESFRNKKSAV